LAPWRKKRKATTISVRILKKLASAPWGGNKRAKRMATISPMVRKSRYLKIASLTLPMEISNKNNKP
jgi:hypothetical protein